MKVSRSTLGPALSLVACFGLLAGGCVANDISMTIDKFIPPDPEAECAIDPLTDLINDRGIYDARLAKKYDIGYALAFVVTNNLPARTTVPIEVQAYFVQGYDVELVVDGPAAQLIPTSERSFFSPSSSVRLEPGGSASASIVAIKRGQLDAIADNLGNEDSNITVRVRPVATRAEEEVEGAFSSFPIVVCAHCLSGPVTPQPCPLPLDTPVSLGNVCNPAADQRITCCQDAVKGLQCGSEAVPPVPMP